MKLSQGMIWAILIALVLALFTVGAAEELADEGLAKFRKRFRP